MRPMGLTVAVCPHFQHQIIPRALARLWEGWACLEANPIKPENSWGAKDFLLHLILAMRFSTAIGYLGGGTLGGYE